MTEWLLDGIGLVKANQLGVTISFEDDGGPYGMTAAEARSLAMALLEAADSVDEIAGCQ